MKIESLLKKCYKMSPIQKGKGCWYKRDDLFIPFPDSPINGTKLRQCVWLFKELGKGCNGVVSACSVKSPQLPIVTRVANEFGMDTVFVIGSKNLVASQLNPMVKMAADYGASFISAPCAYNSALQSFGKSQVREEGDFFLEYGISTTDPDLWKKFYSFGGKQVKNIPDNIKTITMTAGSCNSVLSVMVGLFNIGSLGFYKFNLIGVGPSKYNLLKERFEHVTDFPFPEDQVTYFDLPKQGLFTYDDQWKFTYDDIEFHPRYEGKMMKWLAENKQELLDDENNLIWIVASEPKC